MCISCVWVLEVNDMRCPIYSLYVPFRSFSHNQVFFSHTLLDFLRQFIYFFKYLNTKIIIPKRKHTPFNTFISTSTQFQCITSHLKHLFFSFLLLIRFLKNHIFVGLCPWDNRWYSLSFYWFFRPTTTTHIYYHHLFLRIMCYSVTFPREADERPDVVTVSLENPSSADKKQKRKKKKKKKKKPQ